MKRLTVRQVAKRSGVTVRTLHHYDAIGLLRPAYLGRNGYRYYEEAELLRLQQILLYRELDIPLAAIAALLDEPGKDPVATLAQQRAALVARSERTAELIRTIDRTIAHLNGEMSMADADFYRGFSPEKQREYEDWLVKTYGGDMPADIARSKKALAAKSPADREALMDDLAALEADWVLAMQRGVAADSVALDPLLARYREWVAIMWGRECPPAAFAGLADLHLGHPDFVGRYEALGAGFSDYHAQGMKAHAARMG